MENKNFNEVKKINLTILVDGIPQTDEYVSSMRVEEIIKSLLPPGDKQNWELYILTREDLTVLEYSAKLQECSLEEGSVLSLTKRDGGGGRYAR